MTGDEVTKLLDEIQACAVSASKGPWKWVDDDDLENSDYEVTLETLCHEDVPRLVAMVRAALSVESTEKGRLRSLDPTEDKAVLVGRRDALRNVRFRISDVVRKLAKEKP